MAELEIYMPENPQCSRKTWDEIFQRLKENLLKVEKPEWYKSETKSREDSDNPKFIFHFGYRPGDSKWWAWGWVVFIGKKYKYHSDNLEKVDDRKYLCLWYGMYPTSFPHYSSLDKEETKKNRIRSVIDVIINKVSQEKFQNLAIIRAWEVDDEISRMIEGEKKINDENMEKLRSFLEEKLKEEKEEFEKFMHDAKRIKEFKEIYDKLPKGVEDEIIDLLRFSKQVIFYGPPGTGKTYLARRVAYQMIKGEPPDDSNLKELDSDPRFKLVVFHPAFEYEQFIRGLRPYVEDKGINFKTVEGHFLKMCWKALFASYKDLLENYKDNKCKECKAGGGKDEDVDIKGIVEHTKCLAEEAEKEDNEKNNEKRKERKIYILVIDEINRGNVPLLLGELIYGLEGDKRGTGIDLPYEMPDKWKGVLDDEVEGGAEKDDGDNLKNDFWKKFKQNPNRIYIPHNLYIIGTMNTSDRSIGAIDAAVRRRFAFKYVGPDKDVGPNKDLVSDELKDILDEINKLFKGDSDEDEIRVGGVGHYYLMGDEEEVKKKIKYYLIPLLREYYELGIAADKDKNDKLKRIIKDLENKYVKSAKKGSAKSEQGGNSTEEQNK